MQGFTTYKMSIRKIDIHQLTSHTAQEPIRADATEPDGQEQANGQADDQAHKPAQELDQGDLQEPISPTSTTQKPTRLTTSSIPTLPQPPLPKCDDDYKGLKGVEIKSGCSRGDGMNKSTS